MLAPFLFTYINYTLRSTESSFTVVSKHIQTQPCMTWILLTTLYYCPQKVKVVSCECLSEWIGVIKHHSYVV